MVQPVLAPVKLPQEYGRNSDDREDGDEQLFMLLFPEQCQLPLLDFILLSFGIILQAQLADDFLFIGIVQGIVLVVQPTQPVECPGIIALGGITVRQGIDDFVPVDGIVFPVGQGECLLQQADGLVSLTFLLQCPCIAVQQHHVGGSLVLLLQV